MMGTLVTNTNNGVHQTRNTPYGLFRKLQNPSLHVYRRRKSPVGHLKLDRPAASELVDHGSKSDVDRPADARQLLGPVAVAERNGPNCRAKLRESQREVPPAAADLFRRFIHGQADGA